MGHWFYNPHPERTLVVSGMILTIMELNLSISQGWKATPIVGFLWRVYSRLPNSNFFFFMLFFWHCKQWDKEWLYKQNHCYNFFLGIHKPEQHVKFLPQIPDVIWQHKRKKTLSLDEWANSHWIAALKNKNTNLVISQQVQGLHTQTFSSQQNCCLFYWQIHMQKGHPQFEFLLRTWPKSHWN